MMSLIERWTLYALFLTVGTYAVPELRFHDVPYTVPIAAILAVVLCIQRSLGRSFRIKRWLLIPTVLYVMSTFLSTLFARSPNWAMTFKYAAFGMIPLAVAAAMQRASTIRHCLVCLMISATAVFLYGTYGYLTGAVGDPIEHAFGYFGVTYMASTRNSDQLFLLVPFAVCMAVFLHARRRPGWGLCVVSAGLLTAFAIAIALSYARGAWLTVAVVSGLLLRRLYKTNKVRFSLRAGLLGMILLCIGVVWLSRMDTETLYLLRERWESLFTLQIRTGGNSNENRLDLAMQALALGIQDPLFGIGIGNARHYLITSGFYVNHAENTYLQLFMEQGIMGLGAYVAMLVLTYRQLKQKQLMSATPIMKDQMDAIFFALAFYGFLNSFIDNTWYWTVIALVIAHAHLSVQLPKRAVATHASRSH